MIQKIVIAVVLCGLIYACGGIYSAESDLQVHNGSLIYPGEVIDTGSRYARISPIVNSHLVVEWCDDIAGNPHLAKKFDESWSTMRTSEAPNRSDTVFSYTSDHSKVKVYQSRNKKVLMESTIYDVHILLSGRIHVGATRDVIISTLGKEFANDTLTIRRQGVNGFFEFYFSDDILSGIYYNGYVD